MKKLITASSHSSFEELRNGYHDRLFDGEGCPYLSSSTIKNLFKESWSKDTAATKIGERVHDMFCKMANGKDYLIVKAKKRKNSKAYVEELAEYEATATEEGKILELCNQTDYDSLKPSYNVAKKFFSSIKFAKKEAEAMAFVTAKEIAEIDIKSLSPEFIAMHHWIVESKCGVKCAADLIVTPIGSKQHKIYDYKRSAKRNPTDLTWQIHNLNYAFSVFFYRYVLELIGHKTNPLCTLLMLTDLDIPIQFDIDTTDHKIYETYVAPILAKPYIHYYKLRYALMEGNKVFTYEPPNPKLQQEIEED